MRCFDCNNGELRLGIYLGNPGYVCNNCQVFNHKHVLDNEVKNWECPECGCNKLTQPYVANNRIYWDCDNEDGCCASSFGRETIRALTNSAQSLYVSKVDKDMGVITFSHLYVPAQSHNAGTNCGFSHTDGPCYKCVEPESIPNMSSLYGVTEQDLEALRRFPPIESRCECGGASAGTTHSSWCPEYKP